MNRATIRTLLALTLLVPCSIYADLASDLATHQATYNTQKSAVSDLSSKEDQTRSDDAQSAKTSLTSLKSAVTNLDVTNATTAQVATQNALLTNTEKLLLLCDDHILIGNTMVTSLSALSTLSTLSASTDASTNESNATQAVTTMDDAKTALAVGANAASLTNDQEVGDIAIATNADFTAQASRAQNIDDLANNAHAMIVSHSALDDTIATAPYATVTNASISTELATAPTKADTATSDTTALASHAADMGSEGDAMASLAQTYSARIAPRSALAVQAHSAIALDDAFATALAAIPEKRPAITQLSTSYIPLCAAAITAGQAVKTAADALVVSATSLGNDGAKLKFFAEKMALNAEYKIDDTSLTQARAELDVARDSLFGLSSRDSQYATLSAERDTLQEQVATLETKITDREFNRALDTTTSVVEPEPTQATSDMQALFEAEKAKYDAFILSVIPPGASQAVVDTALWAANATLDMFALFDAMNTWLLAPPSDLTEAENEWNALIALYDQYRAHDILTQESVPLGDTVTIELPSLESKLDAGKATLETLFANGTPNYFGMIIAISPYKSDITLRYHYTKNSIVIAAFNGAVVENASAGTAIAPTPATPAQIPVVPDISASESGTFSQEINDAIGSGSSMYLAGSGTDFARFRELAVPTEEDKINADVKIYMTKSARVGLGSANLGENPGQTLNVLGATGDNSVQIIPDGNCVIDLNSDVSIVGPHPLVATDNFGKNGTHRITFTSDTPTQLVVTAGTEWDLSTFGGDSDEHGSFSKQIMFAGEVRLVLEPGATIRLPYMADGKENKAPVFYFNDNAQLIFQGSKNRDLPRWEGESVMGSDGLRAKIMGCGQFWLNKNAQVHILSPALVGVQADLNTPKTNITFSLQRLSQMLIGTESKAGGALQVGNMLDIPGTEVSFDMTINGPTARCLIAREGFLGFGAGIINKSGKPNGDIPSKSIDLGTIEAHQTQYDAWRLQRLYNVANVTLNVKKGIFEHNNIADGSNSDASVLAIGPLMYGYPDAKYLLKLGKPTQAILRGGGNLVYMGENRSSQNPLPLSIWDETRNLDNSSADSGTCALLTSHAAIHTRREQKVGSTIEQYGSADVVATDTSYLLAGSPKAFFYALRMADYTTFEAERFTTVGKSGFDTISGYTIGDTLVRQPITTALDTDGNTISPETALPLGYLKGGRSDENGPIEFIVPNE